MWRDVQTLRYLQGQWEMEEHILSPDEAAVLDTINTISLPGYPNMSGIHEIRIGLQDGQAKIILRGKDCKSPNMGCRAFAEALYALRRYCGGIDCLPGDLYFQADGYQFMERGLLTLQFLCQPEKREAIMQSYTHHHAPVLSKSEPASRRKGGQVSYQERVVNDLRRQFPTCQDLSRDLLRTTDTPMHKTQPDHLFEDPIMKELYIVEAKKRERDFTEGISQIIQYYAQAHYHPSFVGYTVKTFLITSESAASAGYCFWEDLVASQMKFRAYACY